jgi:hypothetical protein
MLSADNAILSDNVLSVIFFFLKIEHAPQVAPSLDKEGRGVV